MITVAASAEPRIESPVMRFGLCDASAVVLLDSEHFVVGGDENNVLRVFALQGSEKPLEQLDVGPFLEVDPKHREADIEGEQESAIASYWITSHGRNRNGALRTSRYRFWGD